MSDPSSYPDDRSQPVDADAAPEGEGNPSFEGGGPFGDSFEQEFDSEAAGTRSSPGSSAAGQLRFGWQVARMWMKDHQEASMLGAFAVGVLVGSYLRD